MPRYEIRAADIDSGDEFTETIESVSGESATQELKLRLAPRRIAVSSVTLVGKGPVITSSPVPSRRRVSTPTTPMILIPLWAMVALCLVSAFVLVIVGTRIADSEGWRSGLAFINFAYAGVAFVSALTWAALAVMIGKLHSIHLVLHDIREDGRDRSK